MIEGRDHESGSDFIMTGDAGDRRQLLSPNPGLFFVNIRFMFNGDRLAFVKGYKLKKEQPLLPGLDLEQPAALSAG